MNSRISVQLAAVFLAAAIAVPGCQTPEGSEAQDRPNIVVILADDLGFSDVGAYGSEISTPNIDALAAGGLRFSNFHAASTCSPTRSMLLTGVDNHLIGMGNMIEIMADNQFNQPGYEGYLSEAAVTLPTLLRDAGYHTYMAGKWHLGKTRDTLPAARGFERSIALMESGADNWENKPYLPLYDRVHFYEGYEETDLPDDFFSSNYYVDRLIEYIGEDHSDGAPFFAYLSFQAMHYPLQAPQEYIDKYMGTYDGGWETIRRQRYERQVAMGLMPPGLEPWALPTAPDWGSLTEEERGRRSKQMAVYAGMLDNMDHNIGRLWQYLRDIGEADNTVFVFMSDNGADNNEQESLFPDYYRENFDLSVERMGLPGTYANYGPNWANASNSPLTLFKGSGSEGGMRVPFIVHYPQRLQSGATTDAFAYVTDVTPTLLDLAGVPQAEGNYRGREVHSPNGKSMLSLLQGTTDAVHGPDDVVAYELAGSSAVFRGDYKLVKNNPPFGDRRPRLFNIRRDPVEAIDLSAREPEMLREMLAAYARYVEDFHLIEVPDDYHVIEQLQKNVARDRTLERVIGRHTDGDDGGLTRAASSGFLGSR